MTVEQAILKRFPLLSREDQWKVLTFMNSLPLRPGAVVEKKDPCGMFAHLNIHISAADIDEARREGWANFPREFPNPGSEKP